MKKSIQIILLISFLYFCNGCSVNPITNYYDKAHTRIESQGKMEDNLHVGHWEFYDTSGTLVESGEFNRGWRIGNWKYYSTKFDTIIQWDTLQCGDYLLNILGGGKICTQTDAGIKCTTSFSEIEIKCLGLITITDSTALKILSPNDSVFNRFEVRRVNTNSSKYSVYHLGGWTTENKWVQSVLFGTKEGSCLITISFPFVQDHLAVYNLLFSDVITTAQKDARIMFDNSTVVSDNQLLKRVIFK